MIVNYNNTNIERKNYLVIIYTNETSLIQNVDNFFVFYLLKKSIKVKFNVNYNNLLHISQFLYTLYVYSKNIGKISNLLKF